MSTLAESYASLTTPEDYFNGTLDSIPEHVPAELVVDDFDFINAVVDDPIEFWKDLERKGVPEIFYTPHNGGHWTMRRLADIKYVMHNPTEFGNFPTALPVEPGRPAIIPLEIDPPDHHKYRKVLGPHFTPKAVRRHEARIRELATGLIEAVEHQGHCDFIEDVCRKLPTAMFLELMGMPVGRLPEFMEWEDAIVRGDAVESNMASKRLVAYLAEFFDEQKKNPGDNVAGAIVKARHTNGEPWSDEEVMSAGYMLFTAGLDTVANTLGFIWRYLADNKEARNYIRENMYDRLKMCAVFDELIRMINVTTDTRRPREDTSYKGIQFKKDECIVLAMPAANRDPELVENPDVMDLTREVNPHIGFGMADHRCLGSILARQEIIITLREWLTRIPDFSVEPGADIKCWVKTMSGINRLPLVWDTQ